MPQHSRNDKPRPSGDAARPDDPMSGREQRHTCSPPDAVVVRLRAYEISQLRQRNGEPGDADSDWKQAEQEVRAARIVKT